MGVPAMLFGSVYPGGIDDREGEGLTYIFDGYGTSFLRLM